MAVWMSIQMSAGSAHKCSHFNEHYKFSSIKFSFECWLAVMVFLESVFTSSVHIKRFVFAQKSQKDSVV
jgi:hypothetical protein